MNQPHTKRTALITTALLIACFTAQAQTNGFKPKPIPHTTIVQDYFGNDRTILDFDQDGWDDLWCSTNRGIKHRDKTTDTDGDGMTDYQEMIAWRNPFTKGPLPRKLTPEEIAEAERQAAIAKEKRQAELERTWPERRAQLEKTLVDSFPAGNQDGDPEAIRPDNVAWRARLLARRDAALAKRQVVEAELDAIARKHGVKRMDEKGTLVGESDNGPIFMSPQDALSANTIFADDLWPTGLYSWQNTSLSRDLTGTGIKVSIWEANETSGAAGIRTTHSEFSSARAVQIDSTSQSNHATAVANTIIGGGLLDLYQGSVNQGKLLRGIAYEGEVNGHNLLDFVTETTNAVLNGQTFSNHSYGWSGGWEIRNFSGTNWWYWSYPAFSEDPRLGLYSPSATEGASSADLDDFVYASDTHLPVYASGNPNNYGPNQAVTHVIFQNGSFVTSTATRDWLNGDDNYDTVISPATAKNVLTVGSITDINFSAGTFSISGFTGTGPTDDGRIKPDLVAVGQRNSSFGYGNSLFAAHKTSNTSYYNGLLADSNGNVDLKGTSFAAPAVTGGLMLAEQRRKELLPSAAPLLASTWRAAAVHTALGLGSSPGPNYLTGWGSFNTANLVSVLENDAGLGRGTLIKEFSIATGTAKMFYVTLPANTQGNITLAWSDPAGSPPAFASVVDDPTPMLVNNLDLLVQDTVTSANHLPWILAPDLPAPGYAGGSPAIRGAAAARGTDDRNNLEKVSIDSTTQQRRLAVTVSPNGTLQGGTQKVSLILSGVVPEPPVVISSGFTQNPSNLDEFAITISSDPGAFYTLETSTTLQSGSWSDVSTFKAEGATTTVLTDRDTGESKQFWRVRRGE